MKIKIHILELFKKKKKMGHENFSAKAQAVCAYRQVWPCINLDLRKQKSNFTYFSKKIDAKLLPCLVCFGGDQALEEVECRNRSCRSRISARTPAAVVSLPAPAP